MYTKLEGHTRWVTGVAFSTDGRYLMTGSEDHTARVYDLASPSPNLGPLILQVIWRRKPCAHTCLGAADSIIMHLDLPIK